MTSSTSSDPCARPASPSSGSDPRPPPSDEPLALSREAHRTASALRDAAETGHLEALSRAMAAELSRTLVAGRPCIACGATTHPAPAPVPASGEVEATRRALAAAQALVDRTAALVATAREALTLGARLGVPGAEAPEATLH